MKLEVAALMAIVIISYFVAVNGESNWLEGVALLVV
jgi:Ca2+/H+ antiporter